MNDVFISYSRKDKAFVQQLFAALEQQGHDAWVDWDDIEYAEDWWRKIQAGIAGSDNFVFIMSPHSVRSKVCFDEVGYADDTHKRIIPVVIRDIDDPVDQERTHPALQRHNWLFFRPEDDFDTGFATLLETIRREPDHVRMHTRLLVNAQEWVANGNNDSLLLRGDNLYQAETWLQAASEKSPVPTALHTEYIGTSRQAETRRRRRTAGIALVVLVAVVALGIVALTLFQQNQRAGQERASIALATTALDNLASGDIRGAFAAVVQANQIDSPPAESVAALREIAGAPGPVALFTSDSPTTSAVLSPDATRIIAGYADGSLRVWDATVGPGQYDTPLYTTPASERHTEKVNAVAIGRQGRYVASAGCGRRDPNTPDEDTCVVPEVFLWELDGDELRLRNRLNPAGSNLSKEMSSNPADVAFRQFTQSNDIADVGVAFGRARGPIELRYSLDEAGNVGQPWAGYSQAGFQHNGGMITAITYNLDDDILSGDIKGRLRYVQGLGGVAESLDGIRDIPVQALAASPTAPSGRSSRPFLIGFANGQVIVRSRNDLLNNLDFKSPVNGLDYASSGTAALVALENGHLVLLDMANNARTQTILSWDSDIPLTSVDYADSPEADHADYAVSGSADGTLILWDMATTDLAATTDSQGLLAWLHEHRYVASSGSSS